MLLVEDLIASLEISQERKQEISDLALQIKKSGVQTLVFVCTHNSRRSQFTQFFAWFYKCQFDLSYLILSAGTEKTACYIETAKAIEGLGFESQEELVGDQITYNFKCENHKLKLSSKTIHEIKEDAYFAIMTCGDAEENCPYIPEAKGRGALKYKDPKWSDGSDKVKEVYQSTAVQIAAEIKLLMSYLK